MAPVRSDDGSASAGLLPDGPAAERLAGGASWSEGPVWVPGGTPGTGVRGTGELWWSDIPGDRVLGWSWDDGTSRVVVEGAEFANGRTLAPDGRVVQCSHGRRAVEVLRVDDAGRPTVEVLVDRWGPHRLNSPNDVVVRSDGTIWFTDPPYGIFQAREGHPGEREYGDDLVFRHDPATGATEPVVGDVHRPNGLAFDPTETVLYVADSARAFGEGPQHEVRAYDVRDGRTATDGRTVAVVEPGVPDGLRVDERGNLWVSSGDSVQVLDPDGRPLARIPMPDVVGNLCFGGPDGRTLFVACTDAVHRVRTAVRDATTVARAAPSRTAPGPTGRGGGGPAPD